VRSIYATFAAMIRYLKHREIDFNKWDACIERSINTYVYAYSWYLNIVAGEWDALVEAEGGEYQRVFPLPFRKKAGIKYVYQPPFTQQLGLFTRLLQGNEKLKDFLNAIPRDFKLVELNLNKYHIPKNIDGFSISGNRNLELELNGDYERIYAAYSTNLKRNLKKAKKHELQIIPTLKPEELIRLFRENKGREVRAYSDEDYQRLGRLMYAMIHMGNGRIYAVSGAGNNLLAAAFFAENKGRSIFLFSGLSAEGREKAAMPFLINAFIHAHCGSDRILDFEGSNNDKLARFYGSFGASEFTYYSIRGERFSLPEKLLFKLYKKLK
jgi:hypothetical protein